MRSPTAPLSTSPRRTVGRFPHAAQGGFTLVELVTVIVILGILSATAMPKFVNLGADARVASLRAAKGAMASAAAMARAKSMIDTGAVTITVEGVQVDLTNGYPATTTDAQARAFADLAGVSGDYIIDTDKGELKVTPRGVAPANAARCFVTYKPPASAGGAPRITDAATPFNCN